MSNSGARTSAAATITNRRGEAGTSNGCVSAHSATPANSSAAAARSSSAPSATSSRTVFLLIAASIAVGAHPSVRGASRRPSCRTSPNAA